MFLQFLGKIPFCYESGIHLSTCLQEMFIVQKAVGAVVMKLGPQVGLGVHISTPENDVTIELSL